MTEKLRRSSAAALLFALAAAFSPAQWGGPVAGSMHTSKATVADDQAYDPLEVARRATEAGDVERAAAVYQELLDRHPDVVWPSKRAPRSGAETERVLDGDVFVGVRAHVHELLRNLPGDGFAKYVAREGPKADEEFARANAARDEAALRRLVRTRRLLPAGVRAYEALVDYAFDDGRLVDAGAAAESAARDASAAEADFRRRMLARAALAYAGVGDADGLARVRASVRPTDDAAPLDVAGRSLTVSALVGELVAKLPATAEPERPDPVFGARPWAPIALEIQASENRWDERWLSFGRYLNDAPFSYAPIRPVVADDVVYVNTGLEVAALGLFTGRPLFRTPGRVDAFQGRRNWNVRYDVAVDGDLVFAYLEDEPVTRAEPRYSFQGFVPIETIPIRKLYAIDARTGDVRWTHARFDGARDAEERAFLAKLSVTTAPLVLGDRLYVGGVLRLGTFRHWLCCFERSTGAIVWRTYVAQGQAEQNMFGNPVKDCAPGLVGYSDGKLVYSTNVGVAAAVDAATGAPVWISAYLQEPIPSVDGPGAVERAPGFAPHRPVFANGKAFLGPADSLAFLSFDLATGECTPVRDPKREETLVRTAENPLRHLVDFRDGVLVLAGSELVAFDVSGPVPVFKWRTGSGGGGGGGRRVVRQGIDGEPAVNGEKIWFAYRTAAGDAGKTRFMAVDRRSGRRVDEQFADGPDAGGNLVFAGDAALAAGDRYLAAFFDLPKAAQRAEDAAARRPEDARLKLRLGQLRLQAGLVGEAVAAFKAALAAAEKEGPRGEAAAGAARLALYDVYLGLGRDFLRTGPGLPATPEERFALAIEYAGSPRRRAEALLQKLVWAERAGAGAALVAAARTLLDEHAEEPCVIDRAFAEALRGFEPGRATKTGVVAALVAAAAAEKAGDRVRAASFYGEALRRFPDETPARTTGETVSVWRHCYDALDALIKNYGPEVYAKEEAAARAKFEAASAAGDVRGLREVVDQFPNASAAGAARLALVRTLRATNRPAEALAAAQRELSRFGAADPAMVLEAALAFEAAGFLASARDHLVALRTRFGPRTLKLGDGGGETADVYVARRLAEPAFAALDAAPPAAAPLGSAAAWSERLSNESGARSGAAAPELVSPTGVRPASAATDVLVFAEGELRACDLATGARRWRRPLRQAPSFPTWRDGRLYFAAGDTAACVDPRDGSEAWSVRLAEGAALALEAAHGKVYLLVRENGGSRALLLRSLDAATGERIRDLRFPVSSPSVSGLATVVGAASLEADAERLLVRIVGADRGAVVDGLTGDPILAAFPLQSATGVLPCLGPGGLLVSAPAAANLRAGERRIVGRRIGREGEAWSWRTDRVRTVAVARKIAPGAMLVALERDLGGGKFEKEAVLLDLERGTVLLSKKLQQGEFVDAISPGVLDGDLLILSMRRAGQPGSVFARAYDVAKDELRWESVPGAGRSPALRIYPAREHVVLRVTAQPSNTAGRVAFQRAGFLRVLDRRTGKVVDEIALEADEGVIDRPDVEIREGGLVIETGVGVETRR